MRKTLIIYKNVILGVKDCFSVITILQSLKSEILLQIHVWVLAILTETCHNTN